jgi:hypothetical protein
MYSDRAKPPNGMDFWASFAGTNAIRPYGGWLPGRMRFVPTGVAGTNAICYRNARRTANQLPRRPIVPPNPNKIKGN